MRKLLGVALVVTGLVPAAAYAQGTMQHEGRPKHEFGVDLLLGYYSSGDLTIGTRTFKGESGIRLGTPVDVRVGFVSGGNLMFEPRIVFAFDSKGGVDSAGKSTSAFAVSPGVNLLWRLGAGSGMHNQMGNYLTVGAAYDFADLGEVSLSQLSINGGIGMRRAYGAGAWRAEAFARYALENEDDFLPSELSVGLRLGLSLWH